MESGIDADAPLDYVEFQLFPNHDRYEASACSGCKIETIASGLLGQLVLHLPELKDLFSRGSKASFKIQHPKDLDSSQWFTKSTLTSFLHIVGSMDILNATTSIQSEISQLEEARKFHLSLYTKGTQVHSGDGATDSCNLNDNGQKLKDEAEIVPSDSSKNELLQAMELRLTALRAELVAAFNSAAGSTCSLKHISNMEKLSQHFGDIHLRNTLRKFLEASLMDHAVDLASDEKFHSKINYRNDDIRKTEGNTQVKKPSGLDTPVNYGVSPAKVAQVERQSSTESEKSSYSSEDDQPSVERSRSLIRSASPRRSASPMRRVQIGRSGSRRATALTIKSLYFPGKDKTASYRDAAANSSEDEGSKKPPKKSDSSVLRISVKDAISLFENKQKDQTSDNQKRRSTLDAFAGANKSVLRRWSAGIGDDSSESLPENVAENFVCMNSENVGVEEIPRSELEGKTDLEIIHGDNALVEAAKVDERLHIIGEITSNALSCEADALLTQREENTEKLTASAEWNRQKEAELNEMLTKMMENKPVRNRIVAPDKNRSQDVPREQRGGFYDHYKGKRDEKLRGETAEKRAEKEAQFKAMQQILEQRKAAMGSAITNTVSRSKNSLARPQKSLKSSTQSAKKKESPKPAVAKKALSKASPSPVRKSWPSTPSPRATTGASPAKTPSGASSTGTTPTRRKSQPVPTIPQSSPKVERSLQQNKPKNVKSTQTDPRKSTKSITEKLQQPSAKNAKTSTTKVETISGKGNSKDAAKPSFYSKVTKKSSVVPLESKPFLRKGSGIGPGTGPVVAKAKVSSSPEESVKNSENLVQAHKNEVGTDTFDLVNQQSQEGNLESQETCAILELETQSSSQQECDDTVNSEGVMTTDDDSVTRVTAPELKTEAEEESFISPTAWVEIEEHHDLTIPQDDSTCEISSAVNVVPLATSSPRVRHSLSQMLLEESAEPDMVEWGNAENPPSTIYPKDAPKGLKRLLKFARKSKGDQNLTGWSSPSVFSEGEDDAEDSKAFGKKNADTLLRKAALHTSNYGQQKTLLGEGHERDSSCPERLYAQSNINKFSAQSSSNRLQDHISGAATTKATRSFFSLSAFRGSKPNETKLR